MDLQVVLPDEAPDMDPGRPAALARTAEDLGYETVFLPDHVLPPGPYGEVFGGVYEPLVTLAHLAAVTGRIRLGTSVLIVPLRDPFVLAKQVATLDRLSRHRLTLGVGVGWNTEEFAGLGRDFASRGRRTDETLELLDRLFTTGRGPDGGYFEPRPEGPVRILVGGNSAAALRRAVRWDGHWQSAGLSPAAFGQRVTRLTELAGGREIRATARMAWTGGRAELDRAVADARAYGEAGASAIAVHFGAEGGYAERMAAFAERLTSSPPGS
ncbi:TIGR03619 family F420-dependent LLM class oxidoreductase [Amycolatopsis samaneae]|uniref:TIGR03619 family F420-dependent LLM class oxidoreductase n=1 Tax=Amycolatopsis samaneae TaxID=664691 RepID=A0ABW5GM87_9PSEU